MERTGAVEAGRHRRLRRGVADAPVDRTGLVSNPDGAERIDVVTVHLPQRHGRAAERALFAWVEGALTLGADVCVTSWSSYEPREELPAWCDHRTLPTRSRAAA